MRVERFGEAVLYFGSSQELLPSLSHIDAVLTDPPYGVSGQQNSKSAQNRTIKKNEYDTFVDSIDYVKTIAVPIIQELVNKKIRVVLTPGNRCVTLYPIPDSFGAIFQPASVGLQPWGRADAQPILYYGKSPFGGQELPGHSCSYSVTESPEENGHPCPKPIIFWSKLLLNISLEGEIIFDPFMGSGTTGVACLQHKRKFIGVEISETYFNIACRRIEAASKQDSLF